MLFNSSGNIIITALTTFLEKVKSKDDTKKEKTLFNKEQELINIKYVEPFLKDMVTKKKDVDALMKEREALKKRIKEDTNVYNKQVNEKELVDVENRWVKARTDYEQFITKLGEHGETLTKKWETTITEMEEFKKTVKKEKTSGEQKIISDSVNAELKKKLEEINKLKKIGNKYLNMLIGNFTAFCRDIYVYYFLRGFVNILGYDIFCISSDLCFNFNRLWDFYVKFNF